LMILDRQLVIRFFIDIAWSSGKATVCKTLSMGFRLRGTTQIPSTPLTIADCGLMILDRQFVIRFFIDIAWSSGKARICKTLSMGFRLRGTTQIPSTPLIIADCGLMILDRQFVIRFFIDIAWSSGKATVCKTLSMGFRRRGTTQVPSTPLTIADCGLMIADGQSPICNLL